MGFSVPAQIDDTELAKSKPVSIQWVDKLSGDFSFKDIWDYGFDVHRNDFGQLVCEMYCSEECDAMVDSSGRIKADSLVAYYKLVDTTHQYHAIVSEATTYGWSDEPYLDATRISQDTVYCNTFCDGGIYTALHLYLVKDQCFAVIRFHSPASPRHGGGVHYYFCKSGTIKIDKKLWVNGVLKATFNLDFDDPKYPENEMYWNGRIYKQIVAGSD